MKNRSIAEIFRFPLCLVVLIWTVHILKVALSLPLGRYGILPREIVGLRGVLFSPFIHGDWAHLISNTAPLMVMTALLMAFYRNIAVRSFVYIYILTGLCVWSFARGNFHIGASGVIYGLVSFVFWIGVFRKNLKSIVISLVILFLYSGLFIGILPNQPGVSWESHLFGGIMGILVAFMLRNITDATDIDPEYDLSESPNKKYFDSDLFER